MINITVCHGGSGACTLERARDSDSVGKIPCDFQCISMVQFSYHASHEHLMCSASQGAQEAGATSESLSSKSAERQAKTSLSSQLRHKLDDTANAFLIGPPLHMYYMKRKGNNKVTSGTKT